MLSDLAALDLVSPLEINESLSTLDYSEYLSRSACPHIQLKHTSTQLT